jgi:glycerol-3-phosphate acyltransferase PlsY
MSTESLVALLWGYLVGSIPFSYWLARRGGVDLRHVGSGNVGAANVWRATGTRNGALAIGLDLAKGAVAVSVVSRFAPGPVDPVTAGLAAVLGHIYPVWLRFRGGKGVATAAGAFLVIEPLAVAVAGVVFATVVLATQYVSVGSIAGALVLAAAVAALSAPPVVVAGAVAAALIVVHRHRSNLARLLAGTERRVGERL